MEYFKDHKGQISSIRVNSFIAILAALGLSFLSLYQGKVPETLPLIGTWLVAGFGPKVVQKFAESKMP